MNFSLLLTALLAGVAGGGHCVGMCGGIASILARHKSAASARVIPIRELDNDRPKNESQMGWPGIIQLHLGRLFTYAVAGSVVGSLGAAGLLLKPVLPIQTVLFFIGNISLIYLGLRCLGYQPRLLGRIGRYVNTSGFSRIAAMFSSLNLPSAPFARGVLWGCLPCGLVYGVLPIALISGTPWGGALAMACFGLGTMPYLLLTQGVTQRFGVSKPPFWLMISAAGCLILLGCLGLFMPHELHNAGWWC